MSLLALAACERAERPTLDDLYGKALLANPSLVPGLGLSRGNGCAGFGFERRMRVDLFAHGGSEARLEVLGAAPTVEMQARSKLGPWRQLERVGDALRLTVSIEREAGEQVTLRRNDPGYAERTCVDELVLEVGDRRTRASAHLDRTLREFVRDGAWGSGRTKRAGFLTWGPTALEVELPECSGCRLRTHVTNTSATAAQVTLTSGASALTRTLEAGSGEQIDLEVDAKVLSLATDAEGAVVWGEPRFVGQTQRNGNPSVLLLTLDTTRLDHVAPYATDDGRPRTPHIAALAAESTVFHDAFAVAPWTLPSHVSMVTGLYPAEHFVGGRPRCRLAREHGAARRAAPPRLLPGGRRLRTGHRLPLRLRPFLPPARRPAARRLRRGRRQPPRARSAS